QRNMIFLPHELAPRHGQRAAGPRHRKNAVRQLVILQRAVGYQYLAATDPESRYNSSDHTIRKPGAGKEGRIDDDRRLRSGLTGSPGRRGPLENKVEKLKTGIRTAGIHAGELAPRIETDGLDLKTLRTALEAKPLKPASRVGTGPL